MSEKREDRRIRHTKRAIKNAFFELMDEKPVDKISVTELCERADINRSSFYAHYVDYPAFLDELECEIAEKNIELFADLYMRPDYPKVIVGNMLQLIKTKKEMKLFFSDYGNHKGVTRLNEYVYAKAMPMWLKSGGDGYGESGNAVFVCDPRRLCHPQAVVCLRLCNAGSRSERAADHGHNARAVQLCAYKAVSGRHVNRGLCKKRFAY